MQLNLQQFDFRNMAKTNKINEYNKTSGNKHKLTSHYKAKTVALFLQTDLDCLGNNT